MAVSCAWPGRSQIQTCCGQQDKVCKGCCIKPQSPPDYGHFRQQTASGISQWCASWTQVGWKSKCNPKCLPSKMIPQDKCAVHSCSIYMIIFNVSKLHCPCSTTDEQFLRTVIVAWVISWGCDALEQLSKCPWGTVPQGLSSSKTLHR